jgi:hypothetical protein
VVRRPRLQPRERNGDLDGPRPRACSLGARFRAVARRGAVLEEPGRGLPVRRHRAVEPRRRRRDRGRGAGDYRRCPDRRERPIGASTHARVARRDEAEVIELAARQTRQGSRDTPSACARACALLGRLGSIARAGSVFEEPRRRAAVGVDGPAQRRRRGRDARRRAG